MGILTLVLLAILGVLGASSLIVARRPDAAAVMARLAPYQGVVGVVAFVWGVWSVVGLLGALAVLRAAPLALATAVATTVVFLALGFLFGLGLVRAFAKPSTQQTLDRICARLAPYQAALGLVALVLVGWGLVQTFVNHL